MTNREIVVTYPSGFPIEYSSEDSPVYSLYEQLNANGSTVLFQDIITHSPPPSPSSPPSPPLPPISPPPSPIDCRNITEVGSCQAYENCVIGPVWLYPKPPPPNEFVMIGVECTTCTELTSALNGTTLKCENGPGCYTLPSGNCASCLDYDAEYNNNTCPSNSFCTYDSIRKKCKRV